MATKVQGAPSAEDSEKARNSANHNLEQSAIFKALYGDAIQSIKAEDVKSGFPASISFSEPIQRTTYNDEIEKQKARKQTIANDKLQTENEILRGNQKLKSRTLTLLFILLFGESIILFFLTFLQGFHGWGFNLDVTTLRVVLIASLLQISAMLTIAVQHLFPTKK